MLFGVVDIYNNGIRDDDLASITAGSLGWQGCVHRLIRGRQWGCVYLSSHSFFGDESFIYSGVHDDTVVFADGNIYNREEVAALIGLSSASLSVPGLVYHAFRHWGHAFPRFLNGDFSVCVFQESRNRASFYRDHLGLRPLAIAFFNGRYYFSSDPMGLCHLLFGDQRPEERYLLNMFQNNPDMFILPSSSVENVLPGSGVHISPGGKAVQRYWFPERIVQDRSITFSYALEELDYLLRDAIRLRSAAGDRPAAHISGGLDSGVVAAMARKEYPGQKEFFGFSWSPNLPMDGPENIAFDERKRVREVCQLNNIMPLFIDNGDEYGVASLKNWRYPSEYFFEKRVMDLAVRRGVNVIFSGWGGDEFISVGHAGLDASLIKELAWKSFLKKYPVHRPDKLVNALLFNFFLPGLRHEYAKKKTSEEVFCYLKDALHSNKIIKSKRFKYGSRKKVHLQRLAYGHLGKRASDWYILGRRHGVEYRYPLLDKRIVEYMLTIPSRCLVGGNNFRIILRFLGQSMLPGSVLKNKSKDDPVKSHFFVEQASKTRGVIVDQAEELLQNPLLQFVDTTLLRRDIEAYKNSHDPKMEQRITPVLFRMKSAHEFIKGYYKNYNPQFKPEPQPGNCQGGCLSQP